MTHRSEPRRAIPSILNSALFCYTTSMLKHIFKSQFVRQIMGAAGGTFIALTTYVAYQFASGAMHAMLDAPPVAEQAIDPLDTAREQKIVEIGARARALMEQEQ